MKNGRRSWVSRHRRRWRFHRWWRPQAHVREIPGALRRGYEHLPPRRALLVVAPVERRAAVWKVFLSPHSGSLADLHINAIALAALAAGRENRNFSEV